MKKIALTLFAVLLIAGYTIAHDFKTQYLELRKQKASKEKLLAHLDKWKQASPTDAEMFIAYSNHYFSRSQNEVTRLENDAGGKSNFLLQ